MNAGWMIRALTTIWFLSVISSEALAEANRVQIQRQTNALARVSYGLIEYSLQENRMNNGANSVSYLDALTAEALEFELAQTFDNLQVTAKTSGFRIEYQTLSEHFVSTSQSILQLIEQRLRDGRMDMYLNTAHSNLRQRQASVEAGRYPRTRDGASMLDAAGKNSDGLEFDENKTRKSFQGRMKEFSEKSVVQIFGLAAEPKKVEVQLSKALEQLTRNFLPSEKSPPKDQASQDIPPKRPSITVIDDDIDDTQVILRFVQNVASTYADAERPSAMLAQFAVRELQFGALAATLAKQGASVLTAQEELLTANDWYEVTIRCPQEKVHEVVTHVRSQWQNWVTQGMQSYDLKAALAQARTEVAKMNLDPRLRLLQLANEESYQEIIPQRGPDEALRMTSTQWINLMNERLRSDLDPNRLNIEVRGNTGGYTLTKLSSAYPEARLVVIRPE